MSRALHRKLCTAKQAKPGLARCAERIERVIHAGWQISPGTRRDGVKMSGSLDASKPDAKLFDSPVVQCHYEEVARRMPNNFLEYK